MPSSIAFLKIRLLSVFHKAIVGWLKPLDLATTRSIFVFSFLALTKDWIKLLGRNGVSQGTVLLDEDQMLQLQKIVHFLVLEIYIHLKV